MVEVDEALNDFDVTDRYRKLNVETVPICVTFTKVNRQVLELIC